MGKHKGVRLRVSESSYGGRLILAEREQVLQVLRYDDRKSSVDSPYLAVCWSRRRIIQQRDAALGE